jgi:hypothetical protein
MLNMVGGRRRQPPGRVPKIFSKASRSGADRRHVRCSNGQASERVPATPRDGSIASISGAIGRRTGGPREALTPSSVGCSHVPSSSGERGIERIESRKTAMAARLDCRALCSTVAQKTATHLPFTLSSQPRRDVWPHRSEENLEIVVSSLVLACESGYARCSHEWTLGSIG